MDFNPQIPQGASQYVSPGSEGPGVDRSFEALFEGLANTGMTYVENKDYDTQQKIEVEAREGFEQVNDEFGYTPPPQGMQGELDRIVALQSAMEQGKISQVNYYGRLATLSKQLRTKYPRYESIVDSTIQSVTGTRPANAYRDALISEMQSLQEGASDAEKERRSWERQNEGVITAVFGEDYWANPNEYDLSQVQSKVGLWKAESEILDAQKKRRERTSALGEINVEQAGKEADRAFNFTVTSALNSVANGKDFRKLVENFTSSGGQGLDEFQIELTQIENGIRTALQEQGNDFIQSGHLDTETVNKKIAEALAPIQQIKESLLGGDINFATRIATINNDIADRGLNDLYRQFPNLKVGAGISKMNQYAGAEWMVTAQPGGQSPMNQITNIAVDITGNIISGDGKGLMKSTLGQGDQRVSRKAVDTIFKTITDQNTTTESMTNLVDEMFGGSVDFMDPNVVDAADLEQIYTKFLNPEVTRAIREKGTEEDFEKYRQWAFEKFRALPNVRSAAGDVNSILGGANPEDIQVTYDDAKNRISVEISDDIMQARPGGVTGSGFRNLRQYIGTMNKALAVLDPISQASGGETKQIVAEMLGEINRLEEGGRGNGFFQWMRESVLGAPETEEFEGTPLTGIFDEDTDLDFIVNTARSEGMTTPSTVADEDTRGILDMIGVAEGSGYNTLFGNSQRRYGVKPTEMTINEVQKLQKRMGRELGSSAFGKYQIMQDTLRDAIKAMGLSGDEVFTAELQDRIATEFLLKRRGYDDYRAGNLSSKQFLKNLAAEWASIPTSFGGKSSYHGDQMNNKASRGGQAIAKMLNG